MRGFERYRRDLMRKRLSASVLVMAIPLYLSFSFVDYICVPQVWLHFLKIRILTCLLLVICALIFHFCKDFSAKYIVPLSHFVTSTLGLGIGYMTHVTGGLISPYYAGLNWIAIGSLAFWPGRVRDRVITIVTIYGGLILMELATSSFSLTPNAILALTFMMGTCLLSIVNNILSFQSLEREFNLRGELETILKNKEQIIEAKSSEAANLKRLAKQFSPDVIRAIESKTISLNERSRKKVAIIFLDVVDSTNRSNLLDHRDYQNVLDVFFELAINSFLSRNITVANFTGDGLMAIANAPYNLENFEKVAFETCLSILDETKRKRRSLKELWRGEFRIRIGINAGYASVGFFPNTDFGIYTAVGESVNLAARLCSAADFSSMATTKAIISASVDINSSEMLNVKRGGSVSQLKGFAGNDLEYFMVTAKDSDAEVLNTSICPLCSSSLAVAADLGDCFILKCVKCQYSDIQDKVEEKKSAA